ncbi:MAG: hypothetical protein ABIG42_05055 [bacterium]
MTTTLKSFFLLSLISLLFLGCSKTNKSNPIIMSENPDLSQSISTDHGPEGQLLGAYMVHLDGKTQTAEIQPARIQSAISDPFLIGITQGGPAGKWFRISGVQLVSHDDINMVDVLRISTQFEHPFTIDTRPDLCGWDLKAILVYQHDTPYQFNEFNKSVNPPILQNAYGATGEWDEESDKVFPTDADLHQFVIMSEDPSAVVPFDFENPQGWNVFHPGMTAQANLDLIIDSGSSINFMIFLTMGYEISATWKNTYEHPGDPGSRENPIYNPPNGNNRSAWKVEVEETGNGMRDELNSPTTYEIRVWDWQHSEPLSLSKVKQVSISIPGVLIGDYPQYSFTGTGRENDPVVATITVENDKTAPEGDYPALVLVKDRLSGVPGVVTGIKTNWKTQFLISQFETYSIFMHHIEHYDPVNTNLFDIALGEMDKVRDDLYWGRTPDSCWKTSDTMYMFPLAVNTKMEDFDSYHRNPLTWPGYVDDFTEDLQSATQFNDYSDILKAISKRMGYPIGTIQYFYTQTSDPLLDALVSFHEAVNDPLTPAERTQISDDAADIPNSVQVIAARCLTAIENAWNDNFYAWDSISQDAIDHLWAGSIYVSDIDETNADLNFGRINRGGAEIASAFEDCYSDIMTFSDGGDYDFTWITPAGIVAIKGDNNDLWADYTYLLTIDVGGNDNYQGNIAANDPDDDNNIVSVAIDFSGNDNYGSPSTDYAQGAAYMGIAALWDFNGDDVYSGRYYNQGSAYFGCGFLIDSFGADQYNGDAYAQGSGNWGGTGLLLDEAGSDTYYSFFGSQAFAYVLASGTLLDLSGDDTYTADDVDIRYPSAQTNEHNSSLSQAAGFGYRGDPTFMAGGIATLMDFAGQDDYSCGVFGQSSSFMYSASILRDFGPEDDTFHGVWYVQSGNAHMGVSWFSNEAGNDSYTCTHNVSMGGAHDLSHAWFMEYGGNDTYNAPGISLGGGNEIGIGFFLDYDGIDAYHCISPSSVGGGNFSTGRNRNSYGIFVDDGGDIDTYDKPLCGNNSAWSDGDIGGGADGISL